jgi:hypothetical protein
MVIKDEQTRFLTEKAVARQLYIKHEKTYKLMHNVQRAICSQNRAILKNLAEKASRELAILHPLESLEEEQKGLYVELIRAATLTLSFYLDKPAS